MTRPDYFDDAELTWAALGLLTYLRIELQEGDDSDKLGLMRQGAYHWHPDDKGDFDGAWDCLAALGYIEGDGERWWLTAMGRTNG